MRPAQLIRTIVYTLLIVAVLIALVVKQAREKTMTERKNMDSSKTLMIEWQRFVDEEGRTCERCASTQDEVRDAVRTLRRSLAPLGIGVKLEEKTLDAAAFARDMSQSNRIRVGGKPLEQWLGAKAGESPCSTCCSAVGADVECRTVEIGGQVYEAIPAELIVRAGLLAAADTIEVGAGQPCCGTEPPSARDCCR